jgi:hypothetical protein
VVFGSDCLIKLVNITTTHIATFCVGALLGTKGYTRGTLINIYKIILMLILALITVVSCIIH